MKALVSRFLKDESGATAIEYGLIASLIAVAIITAATTLGTNISATFNSVANSIQPKAS
jgi:pilus assembly protein Flp/PilA